MVVEEEEEDCIMVQDSTGATAEVISHLMRHLAHFLIFDVVVY